MAAHDVLLTFPGLCLPSASGRWAGVNSPESEQACGLPCLVVTSSLSSKRFISQGAYLPLCATQFSWPLFLSVSIISEKILFLGIQVLGKPSQWSYQENKPVICSSFERASTLHIQASEQEWFSKQHRPCWIIMPSMTSNTSLKQKHNSTFPSHRSQECWLREGHVASGNSFWSRVSLNSPGWWT